MAEADHIIIHFTQEHEVGLQYRKTRNGWPLHLTLVPWFTAPDKAELDAHLTEVASCHEPMQITVGTEEMFGPVHDIPVNVIRDGSEVRRLHYALLGTVRLLGGECDDYQWTGPNYRPHITHHGDQRFYEGDDLAVGDFHVVRLLPDNVCEITGRYALGDEAAYD